MDCWTVTVSNESGAEERETALSMQDSIVKVVDDAEIQLIQVLLTKYGQPKPENENFGFYGKKCKDQEKAKEMNDTILE